MPRTGRRAPGWARGADALGLEGSVDPDLFTDILAGEVPDGSGQRLGRRNKEGGLDHRPGRDLTFSAPKSVSLAALIGGDERIIGVHDAAVRKALTWIENNVAETRMRDPEMGCMVRVGGQSIVAATFRHDTSRNLDPQLHTHAVIANMVLGGDGGTPRSGGTPGSGKWRTMANERLYASKMLIGALYRAELARGLEELGYAVEKTHADGRFEIAGVPRKFVEAFSTRRAEIEAAMEARGLGDPAANPRVAERAALMTRSHKRDVDKEALRETWQRQAADLGFDARSLVSEARHWQWSRSDQPVATAGREREAEPGATADADRAAAWAVEHLSEREAVFARTDLLTATLAWSPGKVSIGEAEAAVERMEKAGALHAARTPVLGDALTTERALIDETETIRLMERGQGRSRPVMRRWMVKPLLHNGRLTEGQRDAVTTILSSKDRVVGVQGYAGTGKTAMLDRARSLAERRGYRMIGLAPSASATATLEAEAGIRSETLQRFLARNAGVAEERLKSGAERRMRASFRKTVLVVDEGLSGVHRAGARPPADRRPAQDPSGGPRRGREAAGCRGCRKTLRAASARGHEDRGDGRDPEAEGPGPEGGGAGEPGGRCPRGFRKARRSRRRGEGGQPRRRCGRALAEALTRGAGEHRADGAEPRAAADRQRPHS